MVGDARSTTTPIVYVVDDDTDVLGSLRFLLETDGFDVRTFRSGAALLNAIAASEVDCLVIDYKMPAMSGIDLAGRLRNRTSTPQSFSLPAIPAIPTRIFWKRPRRPGYTMSC
jgi:FixJ family two-component response regulator